MSRITSDTPVPEYEYLDSTPTTGGWATFIRHLHDEIEYLAGDRSPDVLDGVAEGVTVGIDHWGAGTVRYLVTTSGTRLDPVG